LIGGPAAESPGDGGGMSTDTGIIRTAFDRVQREQGCEFMDWEG
jgi:hypothetical protein